MRSRAVRATGGGGPARLDDPHHRRRRRRRLRQRHLLERLRLGRLRLRHRHPDQQHARRGGPQPVRLPRHGSRARLPSMMSPTVVAPRRRARARARQRRLEPDPLRDHADDRPLLAEGIDVGGGGRGPAPALRGRDRPRRARDRPAALERLEARGFEVVRWREPNLFFGGVHAVAPRALTARRAAAAIPAAGGAVAVA